MEYPRTSELPEDTTDLTAHGDTPCSACGGSGTTRSHASPNHPRALWVCCLHCHGTGTGTAR